MRISGALSFFLDPEAISSAANPIFEPKNWKEHLIEALLPRYALWDSRARKIMVCRHGGGGIQLADANTEKKVTSIRYNKIN